MGDVKKLEKLYNKLNDDYKEITKEILENSEFLKRKDYNHHENISVYTHSLMVSYYSYKIAKKLKLDYKSTAIAGILHDFYYEDWQKSKKRKLKELHGFVHAKEALNNSKEHFDYLLNDKISNSIVRHMFPLNIIPPKYFEGWIITIVDKIVSLDVLLYPKQWPKYLGLLIIFKKIK